MSSAISVLVSVLVFCCAASMAVGLTAARRERGLILVSRRELVPPRRRPGLTTPVLGWLRRRHVPTTAVVLGLSAGLAGTNLLGPIGAVPAALAGAILPFGLARRRLRRKKEALEQQLADLTESAALAVRSGLSVSQGLNFAATEAQPPMADLLSRFEREQCLGTPFEEALGHMGESIGTDDARLLVLVIGIHARSGGDLPGALQEVAATIRHRIAVRRELRALSAQGRISGTILGSLPIAFFLVLAATSHDQLAPVYRSAAGVEMIAGGLLMEALAYVWIRKLMRVEV